MFGRRGGVRARELLEGPRSQTMAAEGRRQSHARRERPRKTAETDISVSLGIDGTGSADIQTGVGFLDHMLELFARHALFDIRVRCKGDLAYRPAPHPSRTSALRWAQAFLQALGDKKGITRYACVHLPMDETLSRVSVDISGRPFLVFGRSSPAEKIGDFDTELFASGSRPLR